MQNGWKKEKGPCFIFVSVIVFRHDQLWIVFNNWVIIIYIFSIHCFKLSRMKCLWYCASKSCTNFHFSRYNSFLENTSDIRTRQQIFTSTGSWYASASRMINTCTGGKINMFFTGSKNVVIINIARVNPFCDLVKCSIKLKFKHLL